MTHLAFDLGLTTTGVAWPNDTDIFTLPHAFRRSPMTDDSRLNRLAWWYDTFRANLMPWPGAAVWVEAPFIHPQHPTGALEVAKLHGVFAIACHDNNSDIHSVEPAVLKKWATGKGNAGKEEMIDAARMRGWDGDDHNEADAWLLWCLAVERGGS